MVLIGDGVYNVPHVIRMGLRIGCRLQLIPDPVEIMAFPLDLVVYVAVEIVGKKPAFRIPVSSATRKTASGEAPPR